MEFSPFYLLVFLLGITLVYSSSDLCAQKCNFNRYCKVSNYVQITPCAYSCICDGEYSYHVEDSFTSCGSGKRCYQGDCLIEIPKQCQKRYGNNYIGLLNPSNPCVYYCYNWDSPCSQYEESYPNGASCFTYSNNPGECLRGRCAWGGLTINGGIPVDDDDELEFVSTTSSASARAASTSTSRSGGSAESSAAAAAAAASGAAVQGQRTGGRYSGRAPDGGNWEPVGNRGPGASDGRRRTSGGSSSSSAAAAAASSNTNDGNKVPVGLGPRTSGGSSSSSAAAAAAAAASSNTNNGNRVPVGLGPRTSGGSSSSSAAAAAAAASTTSSSGGVGRGPNRDPSGGNYDGLSYGFHDGYFGYGDESNSLSQSQSSSSSKSASRSYSGAESGNYGSGSFGPVLNLPAIDMDDFENELAGSASQAKAAASARANAGAGAGAGAAASAEAQSRADAGAGSGAGAEAAASAAAKAAANAGSRAGASAAAQSRAVAGAGSGAVADAESSARAAADAIGGAL